MYISRLTAKNWRNFTDIDVSLQNVVYLVGPNASGKSNFLDIFRFLRDIVNPNGGGLQKAIKIRGGMTKVRCLAARRHPNVSLRFELKEKLDTETPDWVYELTLKNKRHLPLIPLIVAERVEKSGRIILERPNEGDRDDTERLSQTYLEQINANKDFRDIVSTFEDTLYLHLVPQLLKFGKQLAVQKMEDDSFGQGFLEEVSALPPKVRASRLKRINKILESAIPQFQDLQFDKDDAGNNHLKTNVVHWRSQGAWQLEDQFSDGTLRLISLLWTLMSSNNLILLEEPELSLHGPIVEQIPQLFYKTRASRKTAGGQIIVSTHSERLLSDKSLDADSFLIIRPGEKGEASSIEPLSDDDKQAIVTGVSPANIVFPKTESTVKRLV